MSTDKNILERLQKALGVKNKFAVPRIQKVVINIGMGTFLRTSKDYTEIVDNVKKITGQQPIITKSKKAISNFKLRENTPIGVKVTLRGKRMEDFVHKLVKVVLPRVRDFRGISKNAFDTTGNYTIGLKEVLVFPEIKLDDVSKVHGAEMTIVTTAKNAEEGFLLLKEYGFPFKKDE